jgi:hypothetical protein
MRMTMNKDDFKALLSKPLTVKPVEVCGMKFHLKKLTEEQGIKRDLAVQTKEGEFQWEKFRRVTLSLMLCDEHGASLVDDAEELKSLDLELADGLWSAAKELLGIRSKEVSSETKKSDVAQG